MQAHPAQLAALVAIADEGSFEAAARRLVVTPSAISQRIRALEQSIGRVLVVRGTPCRLTQAGEPFVRLGRQIDLLTAETLAAATDSTDRVTLPVAVNADSLATWFVDVLEVAAGWPDVTLALRVADQGVTADLLRSGEVLAAVTADAHPVQGCSSRPIGVMRYVACASPGLVAAHRRGSRLDWAALPVVDFGADDELQRRILDAHGVAAPAARHLVPSSQAYHAAVRSGLGWGALPTEQLGDDLATGRLVRLPGADHIDVALHVQSWRLDSPRLARLVDTIAAAAPAARRRRVR